MNYYEETLKELEQLIYEKKFDEAFEIIDTELSMPYVPLDFESKLHEFKNKIILLTDKPTKNTLNEDKLFELLKSNKLDKIEKIGLISELNKINLRNHIQEFDEMFLDSNFDDELKTILVYLIYGQQIDHDFKIKYKSNEKKTIMFNTYRSNLKEYEMVPLKIIDLLEKELYNDNIQMFEMGKQLTTTMYYNLFPLMKQIDIHNMKEAIMAALNESNGLDYIPNGVDERYQRYLDLLKKNGII